MKVLLSWMQEFAAITGEPAELADTMTDLGMVVEDVVDTGPSWDGIVVAKVLDLKPHPGADKIQLVDVDTGDGEALQICCGAFNMSAGDLVPLATVGTVMPGGLEIARRKLRGEWSNGMLCSAAELELGEDHGGIMILDPTLDVGTELATALGATSDVVFDLDIEGNRPDALSVLGVTRDLAARMNVDFEPPTPVVSEVEPAATARSSVDIQAADLCPRFGARVLENVTVGESPGWMAARLIAAGMRPINSIVDISNYVMLELGQPNHTYDLDLVPEGRLGVRMGREGETLVTLDDVERIITADDGLIVNAHDEPIGLAGVMGGASTEISESTTSVLLEAAVWDRMTIARTSRRLNLRSEASTRFERGVDPAGIERALDRFCELAVELCGAKIAAGRIMADGNRAVTPPVTVRVGRVNQLLNLDLDAAAITAILDPIGFTATEIDDQTLSVAVPTWRPDSSIEEDVIEEVGRHHGYSQSGKRVPTPEQAGGLTVDQANRRRLRRALLGSGFSEAMPMPFLAPGDLTRAGLDDDGITLANPLVAEESVLRTSLLPGLLKAVVRNQKYRNGPVKLYELGAVFGRSDDVLPVEVDRVAMIGSGFAATGTTTAAEAAVGWLHELAAKVRLAGMTISNGSIPGLHPTRSATVTFRGRTLGAVGEVDPEVLENYEIEGRVGWVELEVAPILAALDSLPKYRPISLYPSSDFDLAFVVPDEVPADAPIATMNKATRTSAQPMVESIELFDVFRSPQLGDGVRSLAYRLRVQASDHTLTDDEVAQVRQACIDAVTSAHGAHLR